MIKLRDLDRKIERTIKYNAQILLLSRNKTKQKGAPGRQRQVELLN